MPIFVMSHHELMHYGVLGMKWGVRRGPPYPLKDGDKSATLTGGKYVLGSDEWFDWQNKRSAQASEYYDKVRKTDDVKDIAKKF